MPSTPKSSAPSGHPDSSKKLARKRGFRRVLVRGVGVYLVLVFAFHRMSVLADVAVVSDSPRQTTGNPADGVQPSYTTAGVLHVHTGYSDDAVGTVAELAAAARATDLGYVIVSDHQSNEDPEPVPRPTREDDVLLMFSQERGLDREIGRVLVEGVDTVLFLGDTTDKLREVASRPDVLAIISHPRSTSAVESWKTSHAGGSHAWEIFNLDDVLARRLTGVASLAHVFGLLGSHAVGRGEMSLLRLYSGGFDEPGVPAFDSVYAIEPITALGALDAHPKARGLGRLWPSYETPMKTLANHLVLDGPLPDDAEGAAQVVRQRIRDGRVYISFGDTRAASGFRMHIQRGQTTVAGLGDEMSLASGMRLTAGPAAGGDRYLYKVVRDGVTQGWTRGARLDWPVDAPGAYRVEVYRFQFAVGPVYWNLRPWIFTNPVRVGPPAPPPAADTAASRTG